VTWPEVAAVLEPECVPEWLEELGADLLEAAASEGALADAGAGVTTAIVTIAS